MEVFTMNNATTLIMEDLSHLKGKSADHITRFLKRCGGGEDSTMVDEHFKSTPTYTRLNDHIIGQLFRLEDSDIAKYLNSVIIATTRSKEFASVRHRILRSNI